MSLRIVRNPWADPREAQRWVHRKVEESGTKRPHLSTCEWQTTILVCFFISTQVYAERAIMVSAIIGASDKFGWNTLADGALVAVFFLGYLLAQVPAGYLADHRLDVLTSSAGVDHISGDVHLNSPVEKNIGRALFGIDEAEEKLEVDYGVVKLDSLMQPTDVVSDSKTVDDKHSRKWKRLKHLRRQIGQQYSKYGARWLISAAFIVWGLMLMIMGIMSNTSKDPSMIYLFLAFRFVTGFCDGLLLVSIQGLLSKEVPPDHRATASSLIGVSMPLGALVGTFVRYCITLDDGSNNAHVEVVSWMGATALIFSVVVFIWLSGAIDETIDRSDLMDHKESLQKHKETQRQKYGIAPPSSTGSEEEGSEYVRKSGSGFLRFVTRIGCFSSLEVIWLHKFTAVRAGAIMNFCWAYAVFSMTSWLPSAMHNHSDFVSEFAMAVEAIPNLLNMSSDSLTGHDIVDEITADGTKLHDLVDQAIKELDEDDLDEFTDISTKPAPAKSKAAKAVAKKEAKKEEAQKEASEEVDQDLIESEAEILKLKAQGILDEAQAGQALLKLIEKRNEAGLRRRLIAKPTTTAKPVANKLSAKFQAKKKALSLGNKTVKVAESAGEDLSDVGFKHNVDGTIELLDRQQMMSWLGMAVAALIATWLYHHLTVKGMMGVSMGWGFTMLIGTVVPAMLYLYIALDLAYLGDVTVKQWDTQFKTSVSLTIMALTFSGLCIPAMYASQTILAPFKAGTVYSVFSIWGTLGDVVAVSMVMFAGPICNFLKIPYFAFVCFSSSGALFVALLAWLRIEYSMIEELCPTDTDGTLSENMKHLTPVEIEEEIQT